MGLKARYLISIIGSLIFAHFYAAIEWFLAIEMMSNTLFPQFPVFKFFPQGSIIYPYQYIFMFLLFLLVGSLPLWHDLIKGPKKKRFILSILFVIFGNVFLTAFIEDAAYFYLRGTWPVPGDYTANVMGYIHLSFVIPNDVQLFSFIIPYYYIILGSVVAILYYFAFKFNSYLQNNIVNNPE